MKKIHVPTTLKNRKGERGKTKTCTVAEVVPYLPQCECFFDTRHLVWGGVCEHSLFAVTTRISASNQQYLKMYEYEQSNEECIMAKKIRIRKLTERECFRLMGVDDTDIDKIQGAGISRSQQYKMAGNSIVVDVLTAMFDKAFVHTDNDSNQLELF